MQTVLRLFFRGLIDNTHWLFAAIATIFGMIFVLSVPAFWGMDEGNHFARAYQIAGLQHQIMVTKTEGLAYYGWGGYVPTGVKQLMIKTNKDIRNAPNISSYLQGYSTSNYTEGENYKNIVSLPIRSNLEQVSFSNTAVYSPLGYIGSVVGIWLSQVFNTSIGAAIVLARVGNLILYVCLVVCALYIIRTSSTRWLFFCVALVPGALISAASVSVDSAAIGSILVFFALCVSSWSRVSKSSAKSTSHISVTLGLIACCIAIALLKPSYAPVILLVAFVPNRLWRTPKRALLGKGVIILCSFVAFILWTSHVSAIASYVKDPLYATAVSPYKQVQYMVSHPVNFVGAIATTYLRNDTNFSQGMVGTLSNGLQALPTWVVVFILGNASLAALYISNKERRLHAGYIALGAWLLLALAVFASLYIQYTPVANAVIIGVQGRYFLPILIFIMYAIGTMLPVRVSIRRPELLFAVSTSLALLASVLLYRNMLG